MEIRQPHTRNVLRTGCAALENAEESLRSRSCKRLMARKLSFVHHRLFSAKAALVLPIPSVHSRSSSARASAISKNWLDMKMRGQDAWRV